MTTRRFVSTKSQPLLGKSYYNLSGGLDLVTAVEQLSATSSPYLRNVRYKSRESVKTRKGPGHYSTAVGQAQDTSQTGTVTSNATVSQTVKQGAKFTAGTSGVLTRVDLQLKQGSPAGTGPILIEVWSDSAGSPGTLLATTSVLSGSVGTSYGYLTAHLLQAPAIVSGTAYWLVAYIQDDGSNSYLWGAASGSGSKSNTNGAGWVSQSYSLTMKTYVSTANPVIGSIRFYQSTGSKWTVFATKAGVFSVNDGTGAVTQLFSGTTTATFYSFEQNQDTLYWVNGVDAPQQWNGAAVSAVPGIEGHLSGRGITEQPRYVKLHKNLLFFALSDQIIFSGVGDPTTYPSVNFVYVPAPKTPDQIQALVSLQDNLFIRTRGTRWALSGADLSTFTLRRSLGLQGVVGPMASTTHENFEYSVSDNGVYVFNGSTDTLISSPVQPELDGILAKSLISIIVSGNYLRIFYATPGSAYNNQALVYDLIYHNWFIDDAQYFSGGCVQKGNGDPETLVLASSLTGAVYYADIDYNDLGSPINTVYYSKYDSYGNPDAPKRSRRFYPEFTAQAGNYNVRIQVDFNLANAPQDVAYVNQQAGGPVWGSFVWGAFTWGALGTIRNRYTVPGGDFYRRQYRFTRSGVNNPVEILGFEDYYLLKRPK